MVNRIINKLASPIKGHTFTFILFSLLIGATALYYHLHAYGSPGYAVFLIMQSLALSYLITYILSLIKKPFIFKSVWALFFLVLISFYAADFYCLFQHQTPFDAGFAAMMLATNQNEAVEFFQTMVTPSCVMWLLISVTAILGVSFALGKLIKGDIIPRIIVIISLLCLVGASAIMIKGKPGVFSRITAFLSYDVPDDLHPYLTHANLIQVQGDVVVPQNVVVIFGESFARSHCSLYQYKVNTNPLLKAMADTTSLFVFNNVTSAATSTMNSFKYMMSTYDRKTDKDIQWYSCLSIIEILKQLPFKTYWISNQAKGGMHNNITRKYAELCDHFHYCGDAFAVDERDTYDEDVIKITQSLINDSTNFWFIHLIGSHFNFSNRYPKNFASFKPADYPQLNSEQAAMVSSYDNSVLYNDFVVYNIMQLFKDKEAIVLYIPDHGLDIYDSSEAYCGHGKEGNEVSYRAGTEIPFLIYTTARFNEKFPETVARIKRSTDTQFCTEDLIYGLADLLNVKIKAPTQGNSFLAN